MLWNIKQIAVLAREMKWLHFINRTCSWKYCVFPLNDNEQLLPHERRKSFDSQTLIYIRKSLPPTHTSVSAFNFPIYAINDRITDTSDSSISWSIHPTQSKIMRILEAPQKDYLDCWQWEFRSITQNARNQFDRKLLSGAFQSIRTTQTHESSPYADGDIMHEEFPFLKSPERASIRA